MPFRFFWISPQVTKRQDELRRIVTKINPIATETTNSEQESTLHITVVEEVISKYGNKDIYVTDQCIFEAERRSINNPDFFRDNHQYLSLCLLNISITSTGFSGTDICRISKLISLLGGTFHKNFSNDTTLVIAAWTASKKVYDAAELDLPIVSIDWINQCFKNLIRLPPNDYLLPCFQGCTFSSSNLIPNQRSELSKMIKNGGGKWNEALDDSTAYLIAQYLSSTKKIMIALKGNVPIIKPEWIRKSIIRISSPIQYALNWWAVSDDQLDIFKGMTFGLDKSIKDREVFIDAIVASGGSYSEKPNYYIVQNDLNSAQSESRPTYVSPRWVLSCISERKFVNINDSPTYVPYKFITPLPDVIGQSIVLYKFDENTRFELSDVLRDFGANVFFSFSKNANFVISQDPDSNLLKVSKEYEIPVIHAKWIYDIMKCGKAPPIDNYIVKQNEVKMSFKMLCERIKRTTSKPIESTDHSETHLDYNQLESFTQTENSSPKRERGRGIEVGYRSIDPIPISAATENFDTFLAALTGS